MNSGFLYVLPFIKNMSLKLMLEMECQYQPSERVFLKVWPHAIYIRIPRWSSTYVFQLVDKYGKSPGPTVSVFGNKSWDLHS